MRTSLKSGFEHFLNLHRTQSAELLAKYLDKKLRGEKGVSETDTEALFDKVGRYNRRCLVGRIDR